MRVLFTTLAIFVLAAAVIADKQEVQKTEVTTSQPTLEDADNQELTHIPADSEDNEDSEVTRKKKSTTTTFCVEIRPSGPYTKPFQVCEPAEPVKPAGYPDASAYYGSGYGGNPEQQKIIPQPQGPYQPAPSPAYKPASQGKPAAAFGGGPVKTFAAPASLPVSNKPYGNHVPLPYSSYRSKGEDGGSEGHDHDHTHAMRMTSSGEDGDNQSHETLSQSQMRTSGYGSFGSPGYGSSAFIPVIPKQGKPKGPSHNGLVITCQPNLAGYAHNVPSSYHHPPAVSNYNYRAAAPRSYGGRYGGRYQLHPQQGYGGGFQQPGSAFKPTGPNAAGLQPSVGPNSAQAHGSSSFGAAFRPSAYEPAAVSAYGQTYQAPAHGSYGSTSYAAPGSATQGPSESVPVAPSASVFAQPASSSSGFGSSVAPTQSYSQGYGQASAAQEHTSGGIIPAPQGPASGGFPSGPASGGIAPGSASGGYQTGPSSGGFPLGPASGGIAPGPASGGYQTGPSSGGYASGPASGGFASGSAFGAYASGSAAGGFIPGPAPGGFAPGSQGPAPGGFVPGSQGPAPAQGGSYNPPGTYRDAEEDSGVPRTSGASQGDKEKHTLQKMEEMSQQRAAGSQWAPEMTTDRTLKNEEHVKSSQTGWSQMRSGEKSEEMEKPVRMQLPETEQDANNEIENSM